MSGRWTHNATPPRALSAVRGSGRHVTSVIIGNALYHTVGDRAQAVKDMALAFDQLYQELGRAIGVIPYEGSAERVKAHPMWFAWWQSSVVPTIDAWNDFRRAQLGDRTVASDYVAYGERFATDWPVYEEWLRKLELLRDGAIQMGIPVSTSVPKLATTVPGDIGSFFANRGEDIKNAGKEVLSLGKVLVYGGLALGGAIVVTSLVNHARSGTDPIAAYAGLRRR